MTSRRTRQPPAAEGSGSAARIRPLSRSSSSVASSIAREGDHATASCAWPAIRPPDASTRPADAEDLGQLSARPVVEREERRPDRIAVEEAHHRQGRFDRDRVRAAAEVREEQRQPAFVVAPRAVPVARPGGGAESRHLPGDLVRGDRHDAVAAQGEDRQRPGVVAGEDRHVARPLTTDPGDLLEVARCLLDGHDARVLGEPEKRVGVDVRAGSRRHVVDDDRQAAVIGDRAEMRRKHPLVRAVVVGSDDERGVGAEVCRPARGPDGRSGVIGTRSGDDGDSATRGSLADGLDGDRDQPIALGFGQGRRFTGGPDGDDAVDPGKDLPADEPAESSLVDVAVGGEGCDECGQRAPEGGPAGARSADDRGHGNSPCSDRIRRLRRGPEPRAARRRPRRIDGSRPVAPFARASRRRRGLRRHRPIDRAP